MKRVAALIAGVVLTTTFTVPAYSAEEFPPIPAPVYECSQAEAYANAFHVSHEWAVAWQVRAVVAEAKVAAKKAKIQRMKATIQRLRSR